MNSLFHFSEDGYNAFTERGRTRVPDTRNSIKGSYAVREDSERAEKNALLRGFLLIKSIMYF